MKHFISWNKAWHGLAAALVIGMALAQGTAAAQPAPTPAHDLLKKMEGSWKATVKAGDFESAGTAEYKMTCGGLWLMSEFKADFGGLPFEGRGFDGYDPEKGKYVSVWVDSMNTRPAQLEGTYDASTKTLTMTGEGPGPDGTPVKHKMVTEFKDDDHHTFSLYMPGPDGEEMKVMTIEYVRTK